MSCVAAAADAAVAAPPSTQVHVHPKRFPAAHSVVWPQRILADGDEFVVVDKPPGVQVTRERRDARVCMCMRAFMAAMHVLSPAVAVLCCMFLHTPSAHCIFATFACQVPPTVDNVLESLVACTAGALGLPAGALLNTHRLDAGTSGVVVLAKNSSFASWFNELLKVMMMGLTDTQAAALLLSRLRQRHWSAAALCCCLAR